MAINSYSTLQTGVANWLNRSDLTARLPEFIRMAEDSLRRDGRVRRLRVNIAFVIDAATKALPADFDGIESLSYDGPTHFGELQKSSSGGLSAARGDFGSTGVPAVYALNIGDGTLEFSPVPDQEYTLRLAYWETVPYLGGAVLSNWLLEEASDIYMYATLMETAPYLKNDVRIPIWERELEKRLEGLRKRHYKKVYSGDLNVPGSLIW